MHFNKRKCPLEPLHFCIRFLFCLVEMGRKALNGWAKIVGIGTGAWVRVYLVGLGTHDMASQA